VNEVAAQQHSGFLSRQVETIPKIAARTPLIRVQKGGVTPIKQHQNFAVFKHPKVLCVVTKKKKYQQGPERY